MFEITIVVLIIIGFMVLLAVGIDQRNKDDF